MVKDSLNSLLLPLSIRLLTPHKHPDTALDRRLVRAPSRHERHERPRSLNDLSLLMLDVAVLFTGLVGLAPAAVLTLLGEEELTGAADRVRVVVVLADA